MLKLFKNPSLITRIATGKLLGLIIGLIGFFILPAIYPGSTLMLQFAFLLWYATFGAIIAVFGVFTYHPVLKVPMPWWFRSSLIGAWLNFVLTLFIYDQLQFMIFNFFGENSIIQSPFWFVFEGAIMGLFIEYYCKKWGGEGKETIK